MNQEITTKPRLESGTVEAKILVPLIAGTKQRIDAVRRDHETRAAFIREAIEAELTRRGA